MRALMASQPTDISSSDRHTVKPWFNSRIAQAPRVVDLTAQGFPLVGGRIDVIGRRPAPTLVYRHRQHLISITALPVSEGAQAPRVPRTIEGYGILRWIDDGVALLGGFRSRGRRPRQLRQGISRRQPGAVTAAPFAICAVNGGCQRT